MTREEHNVTTRHEIPTHLQVEDELFWGLSVRQALTLAGGFSGGYSLWTQWPDLPEALRLGLALGCLAAAATMALVRPGGRGLEEWAFVALHYAALPKASVWRRRAANPEEWRTRQASWVELAPQVAWQESPEEER